MTLNMAGDYAMSALSAHGYLVLHQMLEIRACILGVDDNSAHAGLLWALRLQQMGALCLLISLYSLPSAACRCVVV